jgi:hypothetical protein
VSEGQGRRCPSRAAGAGVRASIGARGDHDLGKESCEGYVIAFWPSAVVMMYEYNVSHHASAHRLHRGLLLTPLAPFPSGDGSRLRGRSRRSPSDLPGVTSPAVKRCPLVRSNVVLGTTNVVYGTTTLSSHRKADVSSCSLQRYI